MNQEPASQGQGGRDFFLTSLYTSRTTVQSPGAYEARHGKFDKPILAGFLPLVSVRQQLSASRGAGRVLPEGTETDRSRGEAERGSQAGVEVRGRIVEQIKAWARGVYVMPQFHK